MTGHRAYRQQTQVGGTRIDLILELYDRALANLDRAVAALAQGWPGQAQALRGEVQLIVSGLAAGIDPTDELSRNLLRLYEFVAHQMTLSTPDALPAARGVLQSLRDGFDAARPQALELERQGAIPPLDRTHTVHVVA
jgi:flagellin-specific chaperone FliS